MSWINRISYRFSIMHITIGAFTEYPECQMQVLYALPLYITDGMYPTYFLSVFYL
jgi:hypothetical protein